ncbi:MAG: NADH-quinone oxidoreductase subunit J [Flavobacteriaceae bacterium]|nr:NADH-quinone oxidoreductase subunit J [Flavobacteriaceae bacterium]
MEQIIFYILAFIMVFFAIASVSSRKILRAVVYLLFVLIGIAGFYFLIDYNYLAAIQLTVYAGGIIVLFIFSVLLIHHIDAEIEVATLARRILVGLASLIGAGLTLSVIWAHPFVVAENSTKPTEVREIGLGMLSYGEGGYILPFEVISILLLAAMIGAIIVAKGTRLTLKD